MNLMNDNVDALRHYVEKVFQKMSNEMDSQSVVSGTIEESVPGHYKVTLINGSKTSLVDAYPMGGDQVYEKGDQVFLLKAESRTGNNFIVKYYVCGLVSDLEEDFEKSSVSERFIQVGEKREYIEQKNDISKYKYVDSSIVSDIKKGGALLVEATITAEIGALLKDNVKNYGLTVSFLDGSNQVLFEGNLDVNYIEGQPYNLVESHRGRVIEINPIVLPQIAKVQVTGFNELTGKTITIHKIRLQPGYVESPYSSLRVEIESVGGDGYFKSGKSLTLKANVTYAAQKLFSEYLEYYWFYADRSVTSSSDSFMIEAGEGWHCVNEKKYAYAVTKDGADYIKIEDKSRYTLKPMGSAFSFSPVDVGKTTKPKIKCIVKYKRLIAEDIYQVGNVTSSNPIVQQNPEIMGFNVKLVSSNETNTLLQPTDKIALTCEITDIQGNKIEYKNTTGFEFNWFVGENKPLRPNEDNPEDTEGTFITAGTLVVDNDNVINNSIEDGEVFYDMTDSDAMFVDIYCIVKRVADGLIEQTNSIRIVSNILEEIKTKTYYRYYYHTSSQITFQQDGGGEWQGYEYTNDQWTAITDFAWRKFVDSNEIELANEDAYSRLYGIENEIKKVGTWWVYYTSKVSSSDWSQPQLYKQVEITQSGDKFSGEVKSNPQLVEQTNTFNELTQYGTKQGGFYTENEEYYINADYIKTGALKVADNNGNVLFNANISTDNPEVQIAGFTVNGANNSLVAGTQGPSDENKNVGPGAGIDYRYFGYDGLQVGNWLWIDENGVNIDKTAKIINTDEGDLSLEAIIKVKTWVVYSSQETLQSSDHPYWNSEDDTNIGSGKTWDYTLTSSSKWMCKKDDVSIKGDEPWGAFIALQMKDGLSPTNSIDYYCISNDNETPPDIKDEGWQTTFFPPTKEKPYVWNYEAIFNDLTPDNDQDSTLLYTTTPAVIFVYGENIKNYQEYITYVGINTDGTFPAAPSIWVDGEEHKTINSVWIPKENSTPLAFEWDTKVRMYDITIFTLESQSGQTNTSYLDVFGEPTYADMPMHPFTQYNYNSLNVAPDADAVWEDTFYKTDGNGVEQYANWRRDKYDYVKEGYVPWGDPYPMRGATGADAPTMYEFVVAGDSDVFWVDPEGNPIGNNTFQSKVYIYYGTEVENISDWTVKESSSSSNSGKEIVYKTEGLEDVNPSVGSDENCVTFSATRMSEGVDKGAIHLLLYVNGKLRDIDKIKIAKQVNQSGADFSLQLSAESIKRTINENGSVSYSPSTLLAQVQVSYAGKPPVAYTGTEVKYYWYRHFGDPATGTTSSSWYENYSSNSITISTAEPGGSNVLQSLSVIAVKGDFNYGQSYEVAWQDAVQQNVLLGAGTATLQQDGIDGKNGSNGKDGVDGSNGKNGMDGESWVPVDSRTFYYRSDDQPPQRSEENFNPVEEGWVTSLDELATTGNKIWECTCTQFQLYIGSSRAQDLNGEYIYKFENSQMTEAVFGRSLIAYKGKGDWTTIDGGRIQTGTINADSIVTGTLKFEKFTEEDQNKLNQLDNIQTLLDKTTNIDESGKFTISSGIDNSGTGQFASFELSCQNGLTFSSEENSNEKGSLTFIQNDSPNRFGLQLQSTTSLTLSSQYLTLIGSKKIDVAGDIYMTGSIQFSSLNTAPFYFDAGKTKTGATKTITTYVNVEDEHGNISEEIYQLEFQYGLLINVEQIS